MFLPSNITLKLGDSGDFVAELQRRLAARDFMTTDMVTSFYDGMTVNAVRQFQTTQGIRADGVAGPETLRRLNGLGDSGTDNGGGNTNTSSEQESGRNLVNQRVMQLQMEEEQLREMTQLQHEIEQQAALQQQIQQQAQQPPLHAEQLQQSQQMTETKKQLPGVEPGRDQHAQQRLNDANMNMQMQQQAFIDRPITQTFQSFEQKPEQKPEQEVGTHNRGPNLGQSPERAANTERAAEQPQQQQQAGISRPRDDAAQRAATTTEQGRSLSPQQGVERTASTTEAGQAASTERAPLRITPASTQGTAPDYGRIRQQMESRLPPHVIEEVKQVGVVMLNNGVQGGRTAPDISAPAPTPGMERQTAIGGGRGV